MVPRHVGSLSCTKAAFQETAEDKAQPWLTDAHTGLLPAPPRSHGVTTDTKGFHIWGMEPEGCEGRQGLEHLHGAELHLAPDRRRVAAAEFTSIPSFITETMH